MEHRLTSYSNLEYNLQEGCRGERYSHLKTLFCELFDVEDVLVVNNNASAVFLILNTFAKNREVVVSRGELVEIGGGFRVPEVMRESGAILKEVGTTNKTKIDDYESAINENTAMLLKIHKSNFDIVGFTAEASLEQITTLAKNSDILDYYDLGSAHAISLPYGLKSEPSLHEVLEYKPSLVSFSGDKLFGSVQAGIIVGKSELIKKLKKNQLLRMLRVDKLTITILEESIRAYLKEEYELLPTIKLLLRDEAELLEIAKRIKSGFVNHLEIVKSTTFVGGGTTPNRTIPTIALHVQGEAMSWERIFRANRLIGRVENDKFLIDLRSVEDEQKVIDICKKVFV